MPRMFQSQEKDKLLKSWTDVTKNAQCTVVWGSPKNNKAFKIVKNCEKKQFIMEIIKF